MIHSEYINLEDDWEYLLTILPNGWQEKAKESGALLRCRNFSNPESLLRTLMIHLAGGCSLRETALRAKKGNIANVSDVALLKRLKASGEWLRWMSEAIMLEWMDKRPEKVFNINRNLRFIDGAMIQEPGSTGSSWKIHYSICPPSLKCDEVYVTPPRITESFERYEITPGDLLIGDSKYVNTSGIYHVVSHGGDVLVSINMNHVPFEDVSGNPFPLMTALKSINNAEIADWDVVIRNGNLKMPGRICAVKKNKFAAAKARIKAIRENDKKDRGLRPETIEETSYIYVFTTLGKSINSTDILEMYRSRWQIEPVFKRLKSIMGLGHLKKKDVDASRSWIHGKLLIALLTETFIVSGERFFPWGYPLENDMETINEHEEGSLADVASY